MGLSVENEQIKKIDEHKHFKTKKEWMLRIINEEKSKSDAMLGRE